MLKKVVVNNTLKVLLNFVIIFGTNNEILLQGLGLVNVKVGEKP